MFLLFSVNPLKRPNQTLTRVCNSVHLGYIQTRSGAVLNHAGLCDREKGLLGVCLFVINVTSVKQYGNNYSFH